MKDTNGDGFRQLPNGDKLTLNLQFATQGIPGKVVQLVAQQWTEVGVARHAKQGGRGRVAALVSIEERDAS